MTLTPRFSERVGAVKVQIQLDSMDQALQNSIWNLVSGFIHTHREYELKTVTQVAVDVLRVPRERVAEWSRLWGGEEYISWKRIRSEFERRG